MSPTCKVGSTSSQLTESDLDITPPRKITKVNKHRQQKFRDAWLKNDDYKEWLSKVPDNQYKAKCRTCNVIMNAELTVIKNHMTSKTHLRKPLASQQSISTFIKKTVHTSVQEAENDSKVWVHEETDNLNENTHHNSFLPEENDDYILILKSEPEVTQLKNDNSSIKYKIKRKKIKHHSLSTASEGTFRGSLDSNPDLNREDEFDIYAKYIASQLRSMDLKKALNLQLEIQSLVSEARLSDLS